MEDQRLRMRDVLAQVWAVVRRRWPLLVASAAIVFIPVGLLEASSEAIQEPLAEVDDVDTLRVVEAIGAAFAVTAGVMLGDVVYAGVVAAVVVAERQGGEPPLREVLAHLPVLRLIGADLLLGFVVAIGVLLLIVPGLVFLVWFALVAPAIKVERLRIRAAFRRSRELVRGHFWLVFGVVIPVAILTEVVSELAGAGIESAFGDDFGTHWLGATITELLAAPVYALAVVVLYFELRGTEPSAPRSA